MSREIHVRFFEGLGVRFPRATRQPLICIGVRTKASERPGFLRAAGSPEWTSVSYFSASVSAVNPRGTVREMTATKNARRHEKPDVCAR